MDQKQAQELNYRIANEWFAEYNVNCGGVSLGDVMAYDVMRVVGGLLLNQTKEESDGRNKENPNIN